MFVAKGRGSVLVKTMFAQIGTVKIVLVLQKSEHFTHFKHFSNMLWVKNIFC